MSIDTIETISDDLVGGRGMRFGSGQSIRAAVMGVPNRCCWRWGGRWVGRQPLQQQENNGLFRWDPIQSPS